MKIEINGMGRAGAFNLVPTSIGAAIDTTKTLPNWVDKFDGVTIRTPIPECSISDLSFVAEKAVTLEEVNSIVAEETKTDYYAKIIAITDFSFCTSKDGTSSFLKDLQFSSAKACKK